MLKRTHARSEKKRAPVELSGEKKDGDRLETMREPSRVGGGSARQERLQPQRGSKNTGVFKGSRLFYRTGER